MEPIQATDYHRISQVADPQLSPDGETVAFVHREPDGAETYETTIWTVPADGSAAAEPFTTGSDDSEPRFGPDGERIAFVRSEDDGPPQLFVVPTDGGEARQVTDVVGGVGSVAWSPAGDRVAARNDVDDTQQFVTGGSFGGFMVAWLVAHTDHFDGAVAQRGVYELNDFYGTSDAFKLVEWDFDATPWSPTSSSGPPPPPPTSRRSRPRRS